MEILEYQWKACAITFCRNNMATNMAMNLNIQMIANKEKWSWHWSIAQRWTTTEMNIVKT